MTKLTKQKRDQLVFTGIGTLVISGVIYFLLISPQMDEMSKITKAREEMRAKIAAARKDVEMSPLVEQRYESATNLVHDIEKVMATGDMYSWAIQTISDFGNLHKEISNVQVSTPAVGEIEMFPKYPYQAARVTVKGIGRYTDIGRFVADLENRYQFFFVQWVDVAPAARNLSDDPEKLDFTIILVTLVKPATP